MGEVNPTRTPQRFGDFDILRELGRGGMGIVYEALQRSLNRRVALKIMAGKLGLTSSARVRFQREAEAAARLHHTNIVAVYATGEEDGTPYYAMELIDGPSLSQVIASMRDAQRQPIAGAQGSDDTAGAKESDPSRERQRPVSPAVGDLPAWVGETITHKPGSPRNAQRAMAKRSAAMPGPEVQKTATLTSDSSSTLRSGNYFDTIATMIAAVADALDYAHNHGVIHRDIKPSNLLLSPDGRLSVNDFGLARMLEQPGMTMTGEFVGSPLYMSPEQIAAGRMKLDHRTDIYSLGVTLYQLLTLQPPFPGQGRDEVIAQILTKEPTRPRQIDKRIPTDLETICLKAIEKDPDHRYQTAAQLAEDLRRYTNCFAIAAKRTGPIGRTVRWMRRRPAVAGLLTCVVALGLFAVILGDHASRNSAELRKRTIEQAVLAAMSGEYDAAKNFIEQGEQYGVERNWTYTLQGFLALERGDVSEALQEIQAGVALEPNNVATLSLLAAAQFDSGRLAEYWKTVARLKEMPCRSFEDFLFKAMGLTTQAPDRALHLMDEAIARRRNSGVAYLKRAWVRKPIVLDSHDPDELNRMLRDAEMARELLPDNLSAHRAHMNANIAATVVHRANGRTQEQQSARDAAFRDMQAIGRFRGRSLAHHARAYYFQFIDDDRSAVGELRRAMDYPGVGVWTRWTLSIALYITHQFEASYDVLEPLHEQREEWWVDQSLVFVVRELPDGRNRAQAAYDHLAKARNIRPRVLAETLCFLGDRPRAAAIVREGAARSNEEDQWRDAVIDFFSNELSTGQILLNAAGNSNRQVANAHYYIGLSRLAVGDRAQAGYHFREAVSRHIAGSHTYHWSRAFLKRIEQDTTWPPWIPLEPSASTQPAAK